ncbi:MAG: hypothetical protein IKR19_07680 [Acholeplasmatales bacterium]|nr:hypothetical protein [Acholeplasmatales bacterium]
MATTDRFNKLQTLFRAIQDLDATTAVENSNILDSVLDVVKDIPKSEYPVELQEKIISNIRGSLIALYNKEVSELGLRIGLEYAEPKATEIQGLDNKTSLQTILERSSKMDITKDTVD